MCVKSPTLADTKAVQRSDGSNRGGRSEVVVAVLVRVVGMSELVRERGG
jgi:hypothetical protein